MMFCIQVLLIALSIAMNQSMYCLVQSRAIESTCGDTQFAVVMDAGSSKTLANVFKFDIKAGKEITLLQTKFMKIKPALSYYAKNKNTDTISKMKADLRKLLDFSKAQINPPECIRTTPIFLKATAGLRNVGKRMAEKILKQVRGVFRTSGFLFKNDQQVSLLSGNDEAIYAWMTTNFEFKSLEIHEKSSDLSPLQTYGILELGGGSAQIAFVPTSDIKHFKSDRITVLQTDVKEYTLYRHSYLTHGIDEHKLRMFNVSSACRAGRCDGEIYTSPCIHPDYIGELQYGPSKLTVHGISSYSGTSRYHECMLLADKYARNIEQAITTMDVPFIATRAFYYLYDNMRQIEGKKSKPIYNTTLNQLDRDAENICDTPPKDIPKIYKAAFLCMDFTYIVNVLYASGIGFEDNIILTPGTSWALGLVIDSVF